MSTEKGKLALFIRPERQRYGTRLREMAPGRLREIGKDLAEAMCEGRKPFWS